MNFHCLASSKSWNIRSHKSIFANITFSNGFWRFSGQPVGMCGMHGWLKFWLRNLIYYHVIWKPMNYNLILSIPGEQTCLLIVIPMFLIDILGFWQKVFHNCWKLMYVRHTKYCPGFWLIPLSAGHQLERDEEVPRRDRGSDVPDDAAMTSRGSARIPTGWTELGI